MELDDNLTIDASMIAFDDDSTPWHYFSRYCWSKVVTIIANMKIEDELTTVNLLVERYADIHRKVIDEELLEYYDATFDRNQLLILFSKIEDCARFKLTWIP